MASLISGNVTVRYNEGSEAIITRDVILAASSRLKGTVNPSITTTTTTIGITTSNMDINSNSNIDTTNSTAAATVGAITSVVGSATSLTVKAERPDHLAGTSTSPASTVAAMTAGSISTGSSLFAGITNSNKTRSDDWLATNSPESPQSSLQSQHVVYTASQQQLSEQPPVAHSSPHQQQQVSNNGYASPMSTGSYDPYSPNGKVGKYFLFQ